MIPVIDGLGISSDEGNDIGPHWWSVNIGSGNGLVLSANKSLPEPILTRIFATMESLGHSELKYRCHLTSKGISHDKDATAHFLDDNIIDLNKTFIQNIRKFISKSLVM